VDAVAAFRVPAALQTESSFDLLFADGGSVGKAGDLDAGLRLLRRQALLQEDGRAERIRAFEAALQARPDFAVVKLDWSSGVILAARRG
jgi:hypothetical protein